MTQTNLETEPFTTALLTLLQGNVLGLFVGDGDGPEGLASFPYAVLYPDLSPELSDEGGTLSDPEAHRILTWTLTSVGRSRQQAQGCADHLRATLLGNTLTVPNRNIWRVSITSVGEVERDDDVDLGGKLGSLFYVNEAISIPSSPA